jgi:phage major head subunit gpT-like protein
LYGIGNPLNAELGKSAASKRQKLAGAFFNDGFDTAWYDGVYFFSASHPYAPNSGIASTTYQSNLISGALSHATLEDMITAGRGFKDPMGRPIPQSPQTLFVDPSNEEYARYLLNDGMGLKSETSNNDKNPYSRFGIKVVSYPYFELTTQYMMKFSGAKSYVNDMIPIGPLPNVPQANHSIKTDIFFVIAFWEENWTGWVGSTGV